MSSEPRLGNYGTPDDIIMERVSLEKLHVDRNKLHYRLHRNQEMINLTLYENTDLTSPGCLVYDRTSNGAPVVKPCPPGRCHYTGQADHDHASWLALSGCNTGDRFDILKKGFIKLGDEALFIEPVRQRMVGNTGTHVMYRFDAKTPRDLSCPLSGNRVVDPPKPTYLYQPGFRDEAPNLIGPTFVEVAVTVDMSLVAFHGQEVLDYVYMIFNVASQLYKDNSLADKVSLTLHSVQYLTSLDESVIGNSTNMAEILSNFCAWQAIQYQHKRLLQPDCNILLTRHSYPELGMSYPAGMCNLKYRCAVVNDPGPYMAFGLAHEIGHLLGMNHDQTDGCYARIMGVNGASGPESFRWSNCSSKSLYEFLRYPGASCLRNAPYGYLENLDAPRPLPGYLYSGDDQCHVFLGPEAYFYPTWSHDPCGNLMCRMGDNITANTQPVMDGTDVNNTRTMCYHGQAVSMDTDLCKNSEVLLCPTPINGGYTEWGNFSSCSQTCGGGVRRSIRNCTNPAPRYGGVPCNGTSVRTVLCNLQPCEQDFNRCEKAYGRHSTGSYIGECGIACRFNNTQSNSPYHHLVLRKWEECGQYDTFRRCDASGRCREFGCDGHLESGIMFDTCGHCGGSDERCTPVMGIHTATDSTYDSCTLPLVTDMCKGCRFSSNRQTKPSCNKIHLIPKDSTNIVISTNLNLMYCSLALLINGSRLCDFFTTDFYKHTNTVVHYTRIPQRIEISGPTEFDIEIQLYPCFDACETKYTYSLPNGNTKYDWTVSYPSCSRSCGKGIMEPFIQCINGTHYVDDLFCDIRKKPSEDPLQCSITPCYSWNVSDWSACSVTCGVGVKSRHATCLLEREDNGLHEAINNSRCPERDMPETLGHCNVRPCSTRWSVGNWSQCSKTCSSGVQERLVICEDEMHLQTEEKFCTAVKPSEVQPCTIQPCVFDCGSVPMVPNGYPLPPVRTTYGANVTYACDQGYILYGPVTRINCSKDGWSIAPQCVQGTA